MSQRETKVPWASLAVVATFVSGTLIVPKAFDLLRPPEKERAQQFSGADLEVDARLWEDPFSAVRRHEAERAERCRNPAAAGKRECDVAQRDARRSPQALRTHLDTDGDGTMNHQGTLLVAVLVPGNPFVGAEEARRRTRFALLSGLQAEGYFPDSAEQIGLMQVPLAPIHTARPLTQLNSSPAARAAPGAATATATATATAPAPAAPPAAAGGGSDLLLMPYELLSRSRNLRVAEAPVVAAAPAAAATASASTASSGASASTPAPAASGAAVAAEPASASSDAAALPSAAGGYERVAVVWIDEAALPGPKLDGVARLVDTVIGCRENACPRLAVIGPSSSDSLNLMLHGLEAALARRATAPDEIDASLANGYRLLGRAHYYTPGATIADEDLPLLRRYGFTVQEFFTAYFAAIVPERASMRAAEREVEFVRTIGADNTVATLLAGEVLQRLPTTGKRRIVTIVESDSIYARGLEQRMRHLLSHGSQVSRIDQAYFFRGIDGVTARDGNAPERAPPAAKGKGDGEAVEWPEARDQLDYLRRMAEELRASEGASVDNGGGLIGAIGIFANDVHDKLLVLQALHDTFPDKVFFTTDMDARFVHPRVLPFTRNLVVASSLPLKMPPMRQPAASAGDTASGGTGLAAAPAKAPAAANAPRWQLQEGTPPLRDAYQTATYLSARLAACTGSCEAVRGALTSAIQSPSVYEIGRGGAVPIAGYDAAMQRQLKGGGASAPALAGALLLVLAGLVAWRGAPAWRAQRAAPPRQAPPREDDEPATAPAVPPAAAGAQASLPAGAAGQQAQSHAESHAESHSPSHAQSHAPGAASRASAILSVLYGAWFGFAAASVLETSAPGSLGFAGSVAWAALCALASAALLPMLQGRWGRRWPVAPWLAAGACLVAAWWWVEPSQPGLGEPLRWLEGISGWPSHFLHLLAVLVVLVSLELAWRRADEVLQAEAAWLAVSVEPPALPAADALDDARPALRHRLRAWLYRHALLTSALPETGSIDFRRIWLRFRQVNEPAARAVRVLFWTVLTVAAAGALFVLLTGRTVPEVPVRGAEHRAIILLGLVAALAALPVLVIAVADATLSTCRLLLALGRGRTVYPPEVVARFARELGPENERRFTEPLAAEPRERRDMPGAEATAGAAPAVHSLLDDWIDMQLIARQTQAVAPLIVAPFIALGLLVAARSRLFDSWAVTWPLALTAALYLLALVALAVVLKIGAERLRSDALARMRADVLWLGGAGPERAKLVEPMKQLIADVEKNTTGAFAPMLEQPLVAALMVPLGSAGGVQLFDHLLLAR